MFDTAAGTTRRVGMMRRAGVMRTRLAEDDTAEVAVELDDETAAKTMMAGKMGVNTLEAEAVTAMADATAAAEDATEDVMMLKDTIEESR
jgi:hypothetical protein